MATFSSEHIVHKLEQVTFTIDFSDDIPSGGSITGGSAVHRPPSGSADSISISTSSPYLYATLPPQSVVGNHYIDVVGQVSDNDLPVVTILAHVVYRAQAAREGMLDIITDLRLLTDAAPDEFILAGEAYWTDAHLQKVLDNHRTQHEMIPLKAVGRYESNELVYKEYQAGVSNLEQGTATFWVQTGAGSLILTDSYTVDYQGGIITFDSDQGGSAYYLTARAYNLNAAAADVWRAKAANVAKLFNFSTDGHNISRGELRKNYLEMAQHFASKSPPMAVKIYRDDINE